MHMLRSPERLRRICGTAIALGFALCDARGDSADEARIDALLAQMSVAQKVGQLTQLTCWPLAPDADAEQRAAHQAVLDAIRRGEVGSVLGAHGAEYTNSLQRIAIEESPLKIPLLFANDVIHGYRTTFPIPLGEAATWDPELIRAACRLAAREARAADTHWTFAPMIDVCRDPRWGRIAETAGEDPYLGAEIAAARVIGFQGDPPLGAESVLACAKHFVAYGGAEGGRDYNTVDISPQTLHEIHLPTFQAAVRAGVGSIMSSFNEINGVPASANEYTLRRILRDRWGFDGLVVSDYESIREMVAHGFAADNAAAALASLRAGVDIDMVSKVYQNHLPEHLAAGRIDMAALDAAVRRVLRAKAALGLFGSNPYADPQREAQTLLTPENRLLAREVARRTLVLLKNGGVLPLAAELRRVAVIGPLADNRVDPLGTWRFLGRPEDAVTVLAGMKTALGAAVEIRHEPGCEIDAAIDGGLERAATAARESDVALLFLGESEGMSGEGLSRANIELPAPQRALFDAVHAAGRPTVVVLLAGRPLAIPELADRAAAIIMAWHPGIECGNAVADVLTGRFNPGGKLPAGFPRTTGQIPIHYNHKPTGRPGVEGERYTSRYSDLPLGPLYPFGFGLSYTTFAIENLTVTPAQSPPGGRIEISVQVRNTGDRAGHEVVQIYFRDPVASQTRPVRRLCAFQRVSLEPGQSQTLSFSRDVSALGFPDADGRIIIEPGAIQLFAGGDSSARLMTTLEITAAGTVPPASQPR